MLWTSKTATSSVKGTFFVAKIWQDFWALDFLDEDPISWSSNDLYIPVCLGFSSSTYFQHPYYAPWCWNIYQHLPEQNHPVLYTMEHMGTFTHWYPHYKFIYINSHYKWIPIIHRIIDKDLNIINIQISEIINKWYPDILNVDVHIFPWFSSQIWRYLLRKFYTSESSGRFASGRIVPWSRRKRA